MAGRFSRSWSLAGASWQVLKQDTQLMVYPLVSAIAGLVVIAAFAAGAFGVVGFDRLSDIDRHAVPIGYYVTALAFYVCLYFVMFFCNAALVGAAMMRFDGRTPTVGDGWRIASARAGRILGYALIAATVGMILRAIQERLGFVGRFVVGLLGVGWTVATSMVVPVLVSHEVGPIDAIKESAGLLKKTWGENVIGRSGLSLAFLVIYLSLILGTIALAIGAAYVGSVALALVLVVAGVTAMLFAMLAHAALSGIYSAALYCFATTGSAGSGFDSGVLQAAFARK